MASKNILEAIRRAITIGPIKEIQDNLQNELRDYFAHQVGKYELNLMQNGLMSEDEKIVAQKAVHDFFHQIFSDIPALKGE